MIEQILPEWVAVAESRQDGFEDGLYPEERQVVSGAVDRRRAEFATVRHCARIALARLGLPPAPILPGERGAPRWPAGVVGSMTHCAGYRAAVLAGQARAVSIGVDAEPHGPLPDGVLRLVARPEELEQLHSLAARCPDRHWDRLLFTMKESVYKAWFPLTGRWLDFQQASVRIDPATDCFQAELLVPGPRLAGGELSCFSGRYLVTEGLAFSAIVLQP
ncbi:MAG TPA: 4'-phosphopantetheinyl transferase superfamily protein [Jatrophihabitans sp.]|jgi:4'-phosphopantetheinyl transferase EntD|nr:4'-phosphopantetheinyl transferase superfamily protein [Jatrophihabitans sp.]